MSNARINMGTLCRSFVCFFGYWKSPILLDRVFFKLNCGSTAVQIRNCTSFTLRIAETRWIMHSIASPIIILPLIELELTVFSLFWTTFNILEERNNSEIDWVASLQHFVQAFCIFAWKQLCLGANYFFELALTSMKFFNDIQFCILSTIYYLPKYTKGKFAFRTAGF